LKTNRTLYRANVESKLESLLRGVPGTWTHKKDFKDGIMAKYTPKYTERY
jgi:hypothetical protein